MVPYSRFYYRRWTLWKGWVVPYSRFYSRQWTLWKGWVVPYSGFYYRWWTPWKGWVVPYSKQWTLWNWKGWVFPYSCNLYSHEQSLLKTSTFTVVSRWKQNQQTPWVRAKLCMRRNHQQMLLWRNLCFLKIKWFRFQHQTHSLLLLIVVDKVLLRRSDLNVSSSHTLCFWGVPQCGASDVKKLLRKSTFAVHGYHQSLKISLGSYYYSWPRHHLFGDFV